MTDDLVSRLTLEEKASLCLGSDLWHTAPVARLGIPAVMVSDGPHGLRRQPDEGDHVGIGGSVPATCFPTAAALGSSWDPDLIGRVGAALGRECREQGVAVLLGPGVNIKRSPLCGRNFEYLSEDPLLSGVLGAAYVAGVQDLGVGTSLKHYAVNNQETDRLRVSADVDERTLREIYLAGFERVVTEARPWTVMCAYNKVNGTYASEHHWLLTEVLRGEWGFDGLVVSDWGAVHDRVAALAAGLDLEMPPNLGVSDAALVAAVRDGRLDEKLPPKPCRSGSRTTPPTSTSPARPGTSATARASSSATAATTPSAATSATRSGTACPTPPSTTPTCAPASPAASRPATSPSTSPSTSPTPARAAARRSSSSTSATPTPPSPAPYANSRASASSTCPPAGPRPPRSGSTPATCPTGRPPSPDGIRGRFDLAVGASSRDLRLSTSVEIDAPAGPGPGLYGVDVFRGRRAGDDVDDEVLGGDGEHGRVRRHPARSRASARFAASAGGPTDRCRPTRGRGEEDGAARRGMRGRLLRSAATPRPGWRRRPCPAIGPTGAVTPGPRAAPGACRHAP